LIINVTIGYQRGILQAIGHVVSLEHSRVAVIAGPEINRTASTIKLALVSGLVRRGLNPYPVTNGDYHLDSGSSAVKVISPKVRAIR
jgi:DNA-binding LacI/PurR family transcriptional regulator